MASKTKTNCAKIKENQFLEVSKKLSAIAIGIPIEAARENLDMTFFRKSGQMASLFYICTKPYVEEFLWLTT